MARASSDILPGFYAAYATLVLVVALTAVFVGAPTVAWGSVATAALGSAAFGYYTVRQGLAGPLRGAVQFARPWLWFAVWAAAGIFDTRYGYRPLVASGYLAAGMTASHLVGGVVAALAHRR